MHKTIRYKLNKYTSVPIALRTPVGYVESLEADMAKLYHHYYIDNYGCSPPKPDPTNFEYLHFLTQSTDFRFRGSGLGSNSESKRDRSKALGQAFCRYFLSEYHDLHYFCNVQDAIRNLPYCEETWAVKRLKDGDTPDYICTDGQRIINIAEAKGTYDKHVSFASKKFEKWRSQFNTIEIIHKNTPIKIKGYIVATKFATEGKPSEFSTIYSEDPETNGENSTVFNNRYLIDSILGMHYSSICTKIRQPLLAASLASGSLLPFEFGHIGGVWELRAGPMAGRKFIGGFWGDIQEKNTEKNDRIIFDISRFRFDHNPAMFFGVELNTFRLLTQVAHRGRQLMQEIEPLNNNGFFYSAVSILKDGTILSPMDFMRFDGIQEFRVG